MSAYTDVVKLARYVVRHAEAHHPASDPRVITDIETLVFNGHKFLDGIRVPASTEARVAFLVREAVRQGRRLEQIMADTTGITTAIGNLSTGLDGIGTQLTQLADQVGALQAGSVTQAQLDDIAVQIQARADQANALAGQADAIVEPDAGETPTP